jgi:hypothetical protein
MKFTLATSLALAAAASAQNALRVEPLSVKILTESQTARIDFTVVDLHEGQNGAMTTCSTAWYIFLFTISLPSPLLDHKFNTNINNVKDTPHPTNRPLRLRRQCIQLRVSQWD